MDERADRLKFSVAEGREKRIVCVGSAVAEQLDERNLCATLTRDASRTNQPECIVQRGLVRFGIQAGVENHLGYGDDVFRHAAAADRVFRDEFEQRRIAEVVATLEDNSLTRQLRVQPEVSMQASLIASVHEVDRAPENGVLNALVMGQVQPVGPGGPFNARLEPRPGGEAVLAGDGELRVAKFYFCGKDLGVGGAAEIGMELADELG